MKMPRNGFDSLAAVARLNTDSTSHHRERWPSLAWVWDELDELRRWQDEAIDAEDYAALEAERDALSDVAEQRDALSEAVRLLLEPEPDMECVQAILMGGRA
jgi:vacuolar-type H+-ATPase catalytic subunit A/Vma1